MRIAKKYKNGGSMVYAHLFGNFGWKKGNRVIIGNTF